MCSSFFVIWFPLHQGDSPTVSTKR
jgi:hypothetical protein